MGVPPPPRGAWATWGVEEQLLISSSCLSPGRVKKLQKFKNYSANLKHSKSTWRQLISSYGSYKIRTSKALGTMQAQHFFTTGTFGNDRSIGQFRASRLITKVSTPEWHVYRSAHSNSFLTLRVIHEFKIGRIRVDGTWMVVNLVSKGFLTQ